MNFHNLKHKQHSKALEEDPLQYLWSVSYCDLLMVLMCFFILFFESEDSKSNPSFFQDIMLAFHNKATLITSNQKGALTTSDQNGESAASGQNGTLTATGQNGESATSGQNGTLAATGQNGESATSDQKERKKPHLQNDKTEKNSIILKELFYRFEKSQLLVSKDFDGDSILLNLSENSYGPGQFAPSVKIRSQLTEVLQVLKPFAEKISITLIGHADPSPIIRKNRAIINSNLVLSSLRASRAMEYVLQTGFDPHWITASGTGQYTRATRSLSFRIQERSRNWK